MATQAEKISQALQEGYSMQEINDFLAKQNQPSTTSTPQVVQPTAIPGVQVPTTQTQSVQQPSIQPQQPNDIATTVGNGILSLLGNIFSPVINAVKNVQKTAQTLPDATGNFGQAINNAGKMTSSLFGNTVADPKFEALAASAAVPFGKGASILTKALLPGAAVGGLQGISQGDQPNKLLGDAALGAAGAGVLQGAAPVVSKILGGGGNVAESAANNFIKGQYNVAKSDAQKFMLGQTVQDMKRYGVTSLDQVTKMSPQITGENGLVTQLTRDAIGKSSPVNLSTITDQAGKNIAPGVGDIAKSLIKNETLLDNSTAKKVTQNVMDTISNISQISKNGGIIDSSGKIVPTGAKVVGANPTEVFSAIQSLESKAKQYSYSRSNNAQEVSRIYNQVASELKTRLFEGTGNGGGADAQLASNVITPEVISKAQAIHPQFAADLQNIAQNGGSTGDLRHLAAPFVRGDILAGKTADATTNALFSNKDVLPAIAGGLVAGGPGAAAGVALEKLVNSNAGKNLLAKGSGVIKNILNGGENVATNITKNPIIQTILGQTGARMPSVATSIGNAVNNSNNDSYNSTNNQNIPLSNGNIAPNIQPVNSADFLKANPSDIINGKVALPASLPAASALANKIPNQPYTIEQQQADEKAYQNDLRAAGANPVALEAVGRERQYIDAQTARNNDVVNKYINSHQLSPEYQQAIVAAPQTYDILQNVKSLVAQKNGSNLLQAGINGLKQVDAVRFATDPDYATMVTQLKALNSAIVYDQVHGRLSNYDLTQLKQLPNQGDTRATALKLIEQDQRNLAAQYVRNAPFVGLQSVSGGGQPISQ